MQICARKNKNWESYWCDLEKSESDESDNHFNNETESDDNNE